MSKEEKKKEMDIEESFPNKPGLLNIYFHVSENSGVGYFRQYLPALKLMEHGLANVLISDFRFGEGEHQEPELPKLLKILNWADVVVVGRKDIGQFYSTWGAMREFFKMPIVMDTDDNVSFVRPSNPGYQGYYPGSEAILWNRQAIKKVFDAITVSTQNLKDFHKKDNPRIYVMPNSLDVKEWDSFEKKKHDDNLIRIGFIGSAAHAEGIQIIKKPMVDILEKYPNVRFLITFVYETYFKDIPEHLKSRIEYVPWINLKDWAKKYKELGLDIGLAPLADNMFNRAKSNLRWLEYSIQKIPAVVSPVEAYSCVRNGEDALVAKEKDEWYNAIEKLVLDKDLRDRIGQTAYDRIKREYNIENNVKDWASVLTEIHTKFHEFFGKKKNFLTTKKGIQQYGIPLSERLKEKK